MSNILPIASLVSTQVQVYHYLIQHPEGYILQYSKVEAIDFGLLHPLNGIPAANDQNDLSLELLLVGLIIMLLPIFTCVAYWLGKKSGKNYNNSQNTKSDGSNFKRKGSSTNPDDNRDPATQARALMLYKKMKSPLVLPSNSICEASQQTDDDCQEESSLRLESKNYSGMEIKPCLDSQSTRPGSSSSEQESLNINGSESCSVMNLGDEGKLALPKFEVNMVRQYSVEQKNAVDMVNALNEEKLKLHTNEDQVSKVEVKYHLSFENKDGSLHKIEKQEIKTIYAVGCKEPENNAVMLKNAYENYQNDPTNQSQSECVFLNKSSECKSPSTALVPVGAFQRNIVPATSENKICLVPTACEKAIESCVKEIETAKSSSEVKAPAFQIDDIPHETGKFAKIFKNVEEIGEGGFGRVYRVVHKLDGKIYAVKKALLKLDSFEDLQQKSKVFREVFAMTDLHHPNIVRYSTCWVEIEKGKGKKRQSKAKSQVKAMETQSIVTEEESESQSQSQSQQSESESSHTNTSSVGFEWDLGENQDSKTQESVEKKRLEIVARKMENTIMKSLTSYNDEKSVEESSPSHMYQTGNTEYFEGYNLYLYIQMEYCSGQNLRDYLDSLKRECSNKKTLGMFRKILEGVYAIHKRGIFHRDLKPANIFLDENENIKIGDFGLASLGNNEECKEPHDTTKSIDGNLDQSYSKTVGTPMYASPEQACGGRYNHKTDIYSLGFILAEMLAGLSTHHERYQLFRLLRDSHDLAANFKAKYPKESELILRMTSFSPDERPTAEELISELDKLTGDGNSTAKELACR